MLDIIDQSDAPQPVLLKRTSDAFSVHSELARSTSARHEVAEEIKETVMISTVAEPAQVQVEEEQTLAFCDKTHECGHACKGVSRERHCLPCLNAGCAEAAGHFEGVNEDELCTICFTQELGAEPCSKLSCGHVFHTNCIVQLLKHKWATLRITFAFMTCPSCKQEIELKKGTCREIAAELGPLLGLKR